MGTHVNTGRGSVRRVETFQVDPNLITEFQTGYCALLQHKKSASERLRYMKSDYIDIGAQATFLRERIDDAKEEEPEMPIQEVFEKVESEPDMDPLKRHLSIYT
jgi:hypothetical protein